MRARETDETPAGEMSRAHGPAGPARPADAEARFTFRSLHAADLPQVLSIERQVFRTPWDEEAFRAFLRSGPAFSWIAFVEDCVAGYALGWCLAPHAELLNLAVDPRWQGRALGSALLRRTFATCADRGARELFLDVRVSNRRAQRLYQRHGFELFGRRRNYYRNPREDALVLRARLGQGVAIQGADPPRPAGDSPGAPQPAGDSPAGPSQLPSASERGVARRGTGD